MEIIILLVTGFAFLFVMVVAVFQWLWNITMPEVFGVRPIRYWVAFRILLMATLLTSGGFLRLNLSM